MYRRQKLLILRSVFNFEVRQIFYITFFVVNDSYNKKSPIQKLSKLKNKRDMTFKIKEI